MYPAKNLNVYPTLVHPEDLLTVKTSDGFFSGSNYLIKNESGRIIRKGTLCSNLIELKLRIIGMKTGVYYFILGELQERFEIV